MDSKNKTVLLTETQVHSLDRMRELNEAFLAKNKCSNEVREFLEKAGEDSDLMLLYLKARKFRPEHAWETLRKKAEVRFDQYPEVYVQMPARFYEEIQELGVWGVLKNKDRNGRRVFCTRGCKWDTQMYNATDLTNGLIQIFEKLLLDKDAIENGVVVVSDAKGMGLSYAKHFGVTNLLRILNTLWIACPLRIKAIYHVNVPFYLTVIYDLIKPFFPKKLKERVFLTSESKKFVQLHANVDKNILPEYLGGLLEYNEAFEFIKF